MSTLSTSVILPSAILLGLALLAVLWGAGRATRTSVAGSETTVFAAAPAEPVLVGAGRTVAADPPAVGRAHRPGGYRGSAEPAMDSGTRPVGSYARGLIAVALALLTLALVARAIASGRPPISNQYEFAVAFAWGTLTAYSVVLRRRGGAASALVVLPVALGLLLYALTLGGEVRPLQPALQHRWLLGVHVAAAMLGYGAAAVAFGLAVLRLLPARIPGRPADERLDDLSARSAILAFPLLTLMLVLGAVWADLAWGRYWSWDPKETAALVTWLIYGAYVHARVLRDWRGRGAAWLLVLGFAAVLFTYFGNLFLGGLHAYA